jgi:hypothetical protein
MTDYGTLLRDHVTLRCRSIDRIFLQAYVPKLQAVGPVPAVPLDLRGCSRRTLPVGGNRVFRRRR